MEPSSTRSTSGGPTSPTSGAPTKKVSGLGLGLGLELKRLGSELRHGFERAFSFHSDPSDGKTPKTPAARAKSGKFHLTSSRSLGSSLGQSAEEKVKALETHVFHGILAKGEHLEDFYVLGQEIGKGAFGVVKQCVDKATGTILCCKSIPKAALTDKMFADIKLEAEIMMHLRGHPHVVSIYGLFEDDEHLHIVEEMCTGGDLHTKLTRSLVPYTEKEAAGIMRAVLGVLQHCHDMGVAYRDVKPDNFLLSTDGPDAVLKATDFGISRFMTPGETTDEYCGTPNYMAPEVFNMEAGFPADVWAAGVTMYFTLTGEFPFNGRSRMALAQAVCGHPVKFNGAAWEGVSEGAKDLVSQMLIKDPKKRPTAKELMNHPWFLEVAGVKCRPLHNMVLQRMREFGKMNAFKKEVMRMVATEINSDYLVGMRAMFDAMDTNSTGMLGFKEVCAALEKQGAEVEEKEVQELMTMIDVDGNGIIDFQEFISAAMNRSMLEKKDLLMAAFAKFDANGDGQISMDELKKGLEHHKMSEAQLKEVMEQVDQNKNGTIDFNEFCYMMFEDELADWDLVDTRPKWNLVPKEKLAALMAQTKENLYKPGGLLSAQTKSGGAVPNVSYKPKTNNPFSGSKAFTMSSPKAVPITPSNMHVKPIPAVYSSTPPSRRTSITANHALNASHLLNSSGRHKISMGGTPSNNASFVSTDHPAGSSPKQDKSVKRGNSGGGMVRSSSMHRVASAGSGLDGSQHGPKRTSAQDGSTQLPPALVVASATAPAGPPVTEPSSVVGVSPLMGGVGGSGQAAAAAERVAADPPVGPSPFHHHAHVAWASTSQLCQSIEPLNLPAGSPCSSRQSTETGTPGDPLSPTTGGAGSTGPPSSYASSSLPPGPSLGISRMSGGPKDKGERDLNTVSVVPEGQEEGPGALSPPRAASPSHRDRRNSAGSTSKSRLGMTPSGHHGDADLGRNSTGASGADAALTGRASTGASKLSKANSFVHVFKRDSETRAKDCAIM